jgi:hypothetical protein
MEPCAGSLADVADEELRGEITTLAAHLTAAECRWLLLLAEFDRRELWLQWGCRTCAFWLSWQRGLDRRAAQEKVRVARALESLPLVTRAFAEGRLSYSKVRAITRIATPEIEADLVTLGLHATASHLESVVRAYRGVLSTEEENARAIERRAKRVHSFDTDDDGMLVGSYRMTPEDGAAFLAGLDAAATYVRSNNPEIGYSASFADALVVMSETFLSNGPGARKDGDRYLAMVNVDADVLHFGSDGECVLHNGPALAAETARRLTCDCAGAVVLRGPDGEVLDIGRKTRTIPRPIRRALRVRDATCRWPGCDEARYLDGHHGRHWTDGGITALSNLVHLCWHHHFLVHEGGWSLTIQADGTLLIRDPFGTTLGATQPAVEACNDRAVVAANQTRGIEIDDTTAIPRWYGDSLDLNDAITALLSSQDRSFATRVA